MRIKEVIKERGLTIKELAARLHVSSSSLSEAINGNPTVKTLESIAKALQVDIRELFDSNENGLYGLVQHDGITYKIDSLESLKRLVALIEED